MPDIHTPTSISYQPTGSQMQGTNFFTWRSTKCLSPHPFHSYEDKPEREPYSPIPKIYPLETEWEYALNAELLLVEALTFDTLIKDLEKERHRSNNHSHQAKVNKVESEEVPAETNLIGAHPSIKPSHPPADNVVSKGQTPSQRGARPCRHCGSKNHWDYDCPHGDYQRKKKAFKIKYKGTRKFKGRHKRRARANLANIEPEAFPAFVAYEQAYLEAEEEDDETSTEDNSEPDTESEGSEGFLIDPSPEKEYQANSLHTGVLSYPSIYEEESVSKQEPNHANTFTGL